ncbi:transposase family protein [Nocardia niigatensis]
MREVNVPAAVVFSGLDPLVVEGVVDEGGRILVQARTPSGPAACPGCGVESARVLGYHQRIVADLPLDRRVVMVRVRTRRLVCPILDCRNTFREGSARPFATRSTSCSGGPTSTCPRSNTRAPASMSRTSPEAPRRSECRLPTSTSLLLMDICGMGMRR